MGLSNQERYSKIVYAVRAITNLGKELPEGHLKTLTQGLWPALLRSKRNSAYWIFGGDTDQNTVSEMSLFGLALLHHKPQPKDEIFDGREDEPYGMFAQNWLKTTRLLEERDEKLAKVFKIFEWIEAGIYGLRRYDDEMTASLRELDDLFCHLQGECFNLFLEEEILLRAWLQSHIIEKLVTWKEDIVNTWWKKQNIHHDMRLIEYPYGPTTERLLEIFKNIQFKDPSPNERALITIEIAGPRWNYAHQHKEALELFAKHNKRAKKTDKIDLAAVTEAAALCEKTYKEREEHNQERYANRTYCDLTEQSKGQAKKENPKKTPSTKETKKPTRKKPSPKKAK